MAEDRFAKNGGEELEYPQMQRTWRFMRKTTEVKKKRDTDVLMNRHPVSCAP